MMAGLRVRRTTIKQVLSHCDGKDEGGSDQEVYK